jgi:hypothetical protein
LDEIYVHDPVKTVLVLVFVKMMVAQKDLMNKRIIIIKDLTWNDLPLFGGHVK